MYVCYSPTFLKSLKCQDLNKTYFSTTSKAMRFQVGQFVWKFFSTQLFVTTEQQASKTRGNSQAESPIWLSSNFQTISLHVCICLSNVGMKNHPCSSIFPLTVEKAGKVVGVSWSQHWCGQFGDLSTYQVYFAKLWFLLLEIVSSSQCIALINQISISLK